MSSDGRAPPDHVYAVSGRDAQREAIRLRRDFSLFYRHYFPRLVRFLITQASEATWAEDVAQEAMLVACDKWDDLLTYERPDSWLFKVALRKLRRLEARAQDQYLLREDLGDAESDMRLATAADGWVEDHLDLITRLRSLPRRQCEVLGLHYLGQYTLVETAQILGIEEGTAKSHLNRGLHNLRTQLFAAARQEADRFTQAL